MAGGEASEDRVCCCEVLVMLVVSEVVGCIEGSWFRLFCCCCWRVVVARMGIEFKLVAEVRGG